MTEFWVSKSKYYCKICKTWMADNKMSRQMHDSSAKHRDLMQRDAQQKKDTKLFGARSDAELQRTLSEINKAAHSAVATDRNTGGAAHAAMFGTSQSIRGSYRGPRPPGAPGYPGDVGEGTSTGASTDSLRQDDSGEYTIAGVTYMEGARHEDKLASGMAVEVFVDAADSWCVGAVRRRWDEPVPHTTLVLTYFTVGYRVPKEHLGAVLALPNASQAQSAVSSGGDRPQAGQAESAESKLSEAHMGTVAAASEEEEAEWVDEVKVKSDRLRIVVTPEVRTAGAGSTAAGTGDQNSSSSTTCPPPEPEPQSRSLLSLSADEYMASMQAQSWQTVAVEVVDAAAPTTEAEAEEDLFAGYARGRGARNGASGGGAVDSGRGRLAQEIAARIESHDDALSTYDPYGTNSYKGYALGDDVVTSSEREAGLGGGGSQGQPSVAFKKRKRKGGGATRDVSDSP